MYLSRTVKLLQQGKPQCLPRSEQILNVMHTGPPNANTQSKYLLLPAAKALGCINLLACTA